MIIGPNLIYFPVIYLLLFFVYLGWGRFAAALLSIQLKNTRDLFQLCWLGWSATLTLLQAAHLFVPISSLISVIIVIVGLILNVLRFDRIPLRFTPGMVGWKYLLFLIAGTLLITACAQATPVLSDSGLYHFNSIRWLQEYSIVPGLGNLHGRLAFNMSFFHYVAFLNLFPPYPLGHNLANSFLVFLLFAECGFALFNHKKYSLIETAVRVSLLPLLFTFVIHVRFSSPTPDTASGLFRIALFLVLLSVITRYYENKPASGFIKLILFFSLTAITIKLSNIMYAGIISATVLILYFSLDRKGFYLITASRLLFLFITIFSLFIWIGRGILLSGCPAYPATALCIETDWSVPVSSIESEVTKIKGNRNPGQPPQTYIGTYQWIPERLHQLLERKGAFAYPFTVALLATAIGLCFTLILTKRRTNRRSILYLLLIPPLWGAIIFWFFMSPQLRLAHAFVYLLGLSGFIPVQLFCQNNKKGFIAVSLIIFITVNLPLIDNLRSYRPGPVTFTDSLKTMPIEKVSMYNYKTDSGLEILVPVRGNKCWDSPLPATPYPQKQLALRGEDIQSGFTVKSGNYK